VGRPDRLTVTVPVNPFCGFSVRVLVPLEPAAMLRVVGDVDNVNVGGGATVSCTVSWLVRLPEVPVMVTFAEARDALLAPVNVTVLFAAVLAGEKVAVTPVGRPDAVSATAPLKPF
jgi:hypothetical protein